MNTKVYVGNLLYETKEDDLVNHFSPVGTVTSATVVRFRNGMSKGFGFVEFENEETANKAIEQFHNTDFMGRSIIVAAAQPPKTEEEKRMSRGNDRRFGNRAGGFRGGNRGGNRGGWGNSNSGYGGGNQYGSGSSWGGSSQNSQSGIVDNWGSNDNSNY